MLQIVTSVWNLVRGRDPANDPDLLERVETDTIRYLKEQEQAAIRSATDIQLHRESRAYSRRQQSNEIERVFLNRE